MLFLQEQVLNPPVTGSNIKAGTGLGMDDATAKVTAVDAMVSPVPLTVGGVSLVWKVRELSADPFIAKANGVEALRVTITDTGDIQHCTKS